MKAIDHMEKNRVFCRHNIEHCLAAARIALLLSYEENLDVPKELIYAAALLHDIGRAEAEKDHREISGELAEDILTDCGFNKDEICEIKYAIACHGDDTTAKENSFRGIFYRADKLSRNCFMCSAKGECYWAEDKKNSYLKV